MIRLLLAMIGYVSTATVITMALGFGYLWRTDRLTNERVFRMMALLQGIDLEQIAAAEKESEGDVPSEEMSIDEVVGQQQILDRNFEVKLLSLQRGRQEFDHRLQELATRTDRFNRLASDWEIKLKQQDELATQESIAKVVSDLEQLKPATAKEMLMQWIDDGRMKVVIMLLGRMSENKKGKILKTFASPDELQKLYEIQRLMLDSSESKNKLQQAQGELNALSQLGE